MTPEQATKRYDRIMKQLSSPSKSTTGKMMKLFAGTNKKTKPASPSNIAERFDKALKGAPFTPKQRTSMYNSANKIYKNFLKESEKGLSRAEKKIKEGTAKYPELNVKNATAKTDIGDGGKFSLSLKEAGGAQLMSPKGGESTGLVKSAIDRYSASGGKVDASKALSLLSEDLDNLAVKEMFITVGGGRQKGAKDAFQKWYFINREKEKQ